MTAWSLLVPALLGAAGLHAAEPAGLKEASTLEPLLPLKIPGYELRVLDVGKPVVLFAGGNRLEASLPVFFYLPNSEQSQAAALVQKAYAGLERLSHQPEWTAQELRELMTDLHQALAIFHASFVPGKAAR